MLLPFNPAIEIRPFEVMYTCALSARTFVCGAVKPVKLCHKNVLLSLKKVKLKKKGIFLPEHANLTFDVFPFSGGIKLVLECEVKLLSHADDAVGHTLDFRLPLSVKVLVAEYSVGDSRTVQRWIRVHGSDDNLQLTVNTSLFLHICGGKGEGANALSV